MVPVLLDTFASQDWRTKCILDLSLDRVIITLIDPRFLSVHHRMADVLARFRRSLGLLQGPQSLLLFRGGARPAPRVCAKLVVLCYWLPWLPIIIQPHREDVDLSIPCLFLPGSLPAVLSSPDLVRLTEDPLSAYNLHPLASVSTLTRDPPSLPFEIATPGFNKGYSSLVVDGKHVLCLCATVFG